MELYNAELAQNIEIMAPVGSYEMLMAAIQGGAHSVYFGVEQLNMRARSLNNFTLDDLKTVSQICKDAHIKSYITLNTVIYDEELELMREIIDEARVQHIDAVIASDQAVMQYANERGVAVHISTQCNVSNFEAVRFYSQFADVIVTARELTLQQVAAITKAIEEQQITGPSGDLVRIEIFAHGALCMAISGKCYLSLDNMNYSANRGSCLQLCRRYYTIQDQDEGFEMEIQDGYIMSPKDLCTIGFIDKILRAGIRVLKIEGRGRSPEYVKKVTHTYRQAVEAYCQGNYNAANITLWTESLKSVYNRGFWEGYYLGKKMPELTNSYGSQAIHKKIYVGKITNYFSNLKVAEVKIETQDLAVDEKIIIMGPTTGVMEDTVVEIRVNLMPVQKAVKSDVCSIPVPGLVRRGDKLFKIINANNDN